MSSLVSADALALFEQHRETLLLLLGIGVRDSELQAAVRSAVFSNEAGWQALEADAASALAGNAEALELVRVLMPRDQFPALCGAVADGDAAFLGQKRIGDQIDLFPNSDRERVLAEKAIAKNAGYKKQASQRDAEKQKKQKKGQSATQPSQPSDSAEAATASTFSLPDKTPVANDAPKDVRVKKVLSALEHLHIEHTMLEHPAVPTVDEMMEHLGAQPGAKCKNLFLKSSKPKFFTLVVATHDTTIDIKALSKKLGSKKPMRFATLDVTAAMLGANKGELSPLCLVNDVAGEVRVAVDGKVLEDPDGAWFHPLTNEASVRIGSKDLIRFIQATGHEPVIL